MCIAATDNNKVPNYGNALPHPFNPLSLKTKYIHDIFKKFPINTVEGLGKVKFECKITLLAFELSFESMHSFMIQDNIILNTTTLEKTILVRSDDSKTPWL